jgi:hypothetical protein
MTDLILASLAHLNREQAYAAALESAAWHAERVTSSGFHASMSSAWLRAAEAFEVLS